MAADRLQLSCPRLAGTAVQPNLTLWQQSPRLVGRGGWMHHALRLAGMAA